MIANCTIFAPRPAFMARLKTDVVTFIIVIFTFFTIRHSMIRISIMKSQNDSSSTMRLPSSIWTFVFERSDCSVCLFGDFKRIQLPDASIAQRPLSQNDAEWLIL
jgi:hypothetical protein